MKSSEVLLAALERMDGGRKWARYTMKSPDGAVCSLGAVRDICGSSFSDRAFKAKKYLGRAVDPHIAPWNDSAPDFSVIEKGFRDAIALAIAGGD